MRWLRFILIPILVVIFIAVVIAAHYYYDGFYHSASANTRKHISDSEILKLNDKALLLKTFAHQKNCNQKIIFLVDMSLSSGKNRFLFMTQKKILLLKAG
ncbi:MAG TPA: hypothetical protein VK787_02665 [Puia sp.]|jgi:hypothetical protein|nr:hypothetical protein [Puia sp.]